MLMVACWILSEVPLSFSQHHQLLGELILIFVPQTTTTTTPTPMARDKPKKFSLALKYNWSHFSSVEQNLTTEPAESLVCVVIYNSIQAYGDSMN